MNETQIESRIYGLCFDGCPIDRVLQSLVAGLRRELEALLDGGSSMTSQEVLALSRRMDALLVAAQTHRLASVERRRKQPDC